ncbi:hypothetical protein C5Y97_16525 [Blastopirellula marina]|uniref:Carboxypeptidase regulatory-like domain-containing protein n=2 Tax=Blastopirellula marina TaxID=124 RepID=A0A2S8FP97_9BACT|nr:hypothetical protein C5Y98_16515 [Blastopirellula marina]PTL43617.1 hypothetical protein C5Y97_16525 [Blastopirellula marina]
MSRFVSFCLILFSLSATGCLQGNATGPTGTVDGHLTKKGKSLSADTKVVFMNSSSGLAAFGSTKEDGAFQILDSDNNEQLPVGTYRVMIQPPADQLGGEEEPSAEEALDNPVHSKPKKNGAEFHFKYRQLSTSGLEYEIKEGPNTIDIDLE